MRYDLVLEGISRCFGKEKVLESLDLKVERGTITALLGPSGCGKSTALKIIAGLLQQDCGSVFIKGRKVDGIPTNRRGVGFVFQNYSLFPNMNVERNIDFGLSIRGEGKKERIAKVNRMLELVDLLELRTKLPFELSGGQQQRVALARALVLEPQLILLDEPFAALDASIRKRIRRDLLKIHSSLGFTSVFVTHDQEEAFEVGNEICVMNKGKIEQSGRPRELYEYPATRFVAGFVGSVNSILLDMEDGTGKRWVMVRPEDITVEKFSRDIRNNSVRGKLISYIFYGPTIESVVLLDNGETVRVLLSRKEFMMKGLRRGNHLKVIINKFRSFSC